MSLLKQIQADQIVARKARDKILTSALTTLYSEAANVGLNDGKRETTDLEVVAVIKKFIKNIDDVFSYITEQAREEKCQTLIFEREVYSQYLPAQLTEADITTFAQTVISTISEPSIKSLGVVMKELNQKHAGKFDGKTASNVVRSLLS